MTGLVYVMKWRGGLYKIGYTSRTIEKRWASKRLRADIVMVIPTDVEYPQMFEQEVHSRLAKYRASVTAELFRLNKEAFAILASYPKCKQYQ